LLLGNGEKREARQDRKTDRPGNQVFSSQLTAPIQPNQKSNRCPQLLFHPRSKQLVNGEARTEASIPSTVARLPQSTAGRAERVLTRAYISRRGR
jgi:hypothetical protein